MTWYGTAVLIPSTEVVISETGILRPGAVGLASRTKALTYNAGALLYGTYIHLFLAKYRQSARISVIVQPNGIEHSSVDTAHGIR